MVFTTFGCLFVKKIKNKFLLSSMKSLTDCENLPVTLFNELVPAYPYPLVTLKFVRKPLENLPWIYTGENQPIWAKESRNRNLMWLLEQSSESVSISKKQAETWCFFFLNKAGQEIKNHLRMCRKS
jgi:hypothetical protein